jgi:hypothetical protein
MVLMNLGVVMLPIIELGRSFVDPVHTLLQRCGVLRGDVSTALVREPTDAPAETSEVLCLPTCRNIGRTAAPTLSAEEFPWHRIDLDR